MAQYLVTMDIETADPLLPIDELAGVLRESILPSIESLVALKAQGKVVTGGYPIGERYMVFVVEADSEAQVNEVLGNLPISDIARTKVRRLRTVEELQNKDNAL